MRPERAKIAESEPEPEIEIEIEIDADDEKAFDEAVVAIRERKAISLETFHERMRQL